MERILALQTLSAGSNFIEPVSSGDSTVSVNCSTESKVCSAQSNNCGDTITQAQWW